jgi:hypothetical protein
MPWHKVQISGERVQLGALTHLVNVYSEIRLKAGGPLNAGMYDRQATDGSVTVFLSPKASELASALLREYNAEPCEQPTGVSMLVGDQSDKLAL